MDMLQDLYCNHVSNDEKYAQLGPIPEVVKAEAEAADFMGNTLESEEIINGIAATNEMQGWIRGFQYAMQLMAACGASIPFKQD